MAWPPGVSDFKAQFVREFIYGSGLDKITDNDIQRALNEAPPRFNQCLLDTLVEQTAAFLYLAAHIMWVNIQNAGGLSAVPRGRGVRSQPQAIINSASVGQVSQSNQPPPERISSSPALSELWASPFGRIYVGMISPRLIGNMAVVSGPDAEIPTGVDQQ